jgi:hypothetical protein
MLTTSQVPVQDFTADGRCYRIRLMSTDPVDEAERTLVEALGDHYSFRDAGGERFRVRSCGVFVETDPLAYGAELDVVFSSDTRLDHPAGRGALLWIRVVHQVAGGRAASYVDTIGGVEPFTSVVQLDYVDRVTRCADRGVTPERLAAKLFLVRDTGADVVTILGGITYGWQVSELTP